MSNGVGSVREILQPLMFHYGFDAIERDGQLKFQQRNGQRPIMLDPKEIAVIDDMEGRLQQRRDSSAELVGKVSFDFIEAEADYDVASVDVALPGDDNPSLAQHELPLALTRTEGRQLAG
ncbi:MAG: phage tail protein [Marinovum sp.]|nr:phage tail protein [Marinovum sp.]